MIIDSHIKGSDLNESLKNFWDLAKTKVEILNKKYDASQGAPVFTINGEYTTRGWTEWTQGFQFGIPFQQIFYRLYPYKFSPLGAQLTTVMHQLTFESLLPEQVNLFY